MRTFGKVFFWFNIITLVPFFWWLFTPAKKRMQPSYTSIPGQVRVLSGTPGSAPVVLPSGVPVQSDQPNSYLAGLAAVGKRACEGELIQMVQRELGQGDCSQQFLRFEADMQLTLQHKEQVEGVRVDMENCIATDNTGEVTDLQSVWADLEEITRLTIRNRFQLPTEDEGIRRRYSRMTGVGACSLYKTVHYWAAHPGEMPLPDEMPNNIYFNPSTGKPEKSYALKAFVETFRTALKLRQEQ